MSESNNLLERNSILQQTKNYHKRVFYVVISCTSLLFLVSLVISRGATGFMVFNSGYYDTFMDFFTPFTSAIENSFITTQTAFSTVIFKLLSFPLTQDTLNGAIQFQNEFSFAGQSVVRLYQDFMMPFVVYTFMLALATSFLLFVLKKGNAKEKWLFIALLFFSSPFLFAFAHANIVMLAFVLVLVFFASYQLQKKWLCEIGAICLGLAVAIQPQLIFLSVILVLCKKYKLFIRAICYSFVAFCLPYFILRETMALIDMIKTTFLIDMKDTDALFFTSQFSNIPECIACVFNWDSVNIAIVGKIVSYVLLCAGIVASFFLNEKWKAVAILVCISVGFATNSPIYNLIFVSIPIAFFLDNAKNKKVSNFIYLFFFLLMMIPKPWGTILLKYEVPLSSIIDSACLIFITLMLAIEGLMGLNKARSVSGKIL
jgi:hypothetical protein